MHILPSEKVSYLVGAPEIEAGPVQPYDALVISFLDELSTSLRKNPEAVAFPDILSFAFWCRRAHIELLRKKFDLKEIRLGRGIAFHIAPSNVPINFAFSYVFGLLAGCANIVRVPTRDFPQVKIVSRGIGELLSKPEFKAIAVRTSFVKYEASDLVTEKFSSIAHVRILWGGDETIRKLKGYSSSERVVDVAFADRYSFCIMNGQKVLDLSLVDLNRLAERFYNDSYLMDQNACSSPHLLVWFGKQSPEGRERFWKALESVVEKKYALQPIQVMEKYLHACQDAIELAQVEKFISHKNLIYRVPLRSLPGELDSLRGRYGYFYEYETGDLSELAPLVNSKYQTLTYFGIDPKALVDFTIQNHLLGIDRIVEVGSALDIGIHWDGFDLIRTLSRRIEVH